MRIGVAREIKTDEYRVALTPAGARELVLKGHEVLVETGAGDGSSFPDGDYERAGAEIVSVDDAWGRAELLLKVKEPIAAEYPRLREGLVLFTYLHIAADAPLTHALVDSGIAAVAYETVETDDRRLPLLAPMSEIAGRLAAQAGAYFLEKPLGGRGLLLGGVPARSTPRPPSGFSRKCAAACGASLPAISLIGASSGSFRSSVSTVSYATAAMPLSTSARVSGSSAAMWR